MSAYIVNDTCLHRIVTFVSSPRHDVRAIGQLTADLATLGLARGDLIDRNALGQAMAEMNARAVAVRYAGDQPEIAYTWQLSPASPTQVYKSLQCFLYQCSEENVPEAPLFQALKRYEADLADWIVCATKEYTAAEWG